MKIKIEPVLIIGGKVKDVAIQLEESNFSDNGTSISDVGLAIEMLCDALAQIDRMELSAHTRHTLKQNSRWALRETNHDKDDYETLKEKNAKLQFANEFLLEELAKRKRPTKHLIT